jgi:aminomethyltransferase
MTEETLKQTPLHQTHVDAGGRMVPFAGWDMPVQYSGILDEVRAVRTGTGLFDVSHMGRLFIEGPGAAEFLNRVLSTNVPKLRLGRARYGVICDESGGIIDDCIVYRLGETRYMLVPNASNTAAVSEWIGRWAPAASESTTVDATSELAMVAVQGPSAMEMLQPLVAADLSEMKMFAVIETSINGVTGTIARTGYTGEDGVEFFVPSESVAAIWSKLTDSGAVPCGLGARDVLRLEAGLLLHGNDMDTSVNPYEAGLDRFVNANRDTYVAGPALRKIRDAGPTRKIVGLAVSGRRVVRAGHPIHSGGQQVGSVSSGSFSPTLDRNIALGYVPTALAAEGTPLTVDVRGNEVEVEVASLPFYSRPR